MKFTMQFKLPSLFVVFLALLSFSNLLSFASAHPSSPNWKRDDAAEKAKRTKVYESSLKKGNEIVAELHKPHPPASKWTDYEDITKEGWAVKLSSDPKSDDILQSGDVYQDLKVSESNDIFIKASHKATGAFYANVYNTENGVVIADNLLSPSEALKKHAKAGVHAPQLAFWSDVTYLQYEELACKAGDDVRNMKYIFQAVISNDETVDTIEHIIQDLEHTVLQTWGRKKTYALSDDKAKALIGTPNGKGVARMVFNHKAQLGKTIKSVSIFTEDATNPKKPTASKKARTLFMMFELE